MKQRLGVITGANGQIGSYLARRKALKAGPMLLIVQQRRDRLSSLEGNPRIRIAECDLMSQEQLQSVVEIAVREMDAAPAYLIHAAALRSSDAKAIAESEPAIFDQVLRQNVTAAFNALRCLLPWFREQGFGRAVLFGSNVTRTGLAHGAAYAAAKAAIANLVHTAALENGDLDILVNMVSPGPVDTALEEDYQGEYLLFRKRYFETYKAHSPTHNLISLNEIGAAVEFLLSAELRNLTGQELILDGGKS